MAAAIERIVPLVAFGMPGEHFGAGRLLTDDESWRKKFEVLATASTAILIIPSYQRGIMWEMRWLKCTGLLAKCIFIMPPELSSGDVTRVWSRTSTILEKLGLHLPSWRPAGLIFKLGPDGKVAAEHKLNVSSRIAFGWGVRRLMKSSDPYPVSPGDESHPAGATELSGVDEPSGVDQTSDATVAEGLPDERSDPLALLEEPEKQPTAFTFTRNVLLLTGGLTLALRVFFQSLFPLVPALLIGWVASKFVRRSAVPILPAFSLQAGLLAWMLVGFLISPTTFPAGFAVDLLALGGGLAWLIIRPGLWPTALLILYQTIGLTINISNQSLFNNNIISPYNFLWICMRIISIVLMFYGYRIIRKENALSATLSGTPTSTSGSPFALSLTASNGVSPDFHQPFALIINPANQAPQFKSGDGFAITNHQSASFTISVTAVPTATITEVGTLPPGLTFQDNGNNTATISGTPNLTNSNSPIQFPVVFTASNGVSPNATQLATIFVETDLTKPTITAPISVTTRVGESITEPCKTTESFCGTEVGGTEAGQVRYC